MWGNFELVQSYPSTVYDFLFYEAQENGFELEKNNTYIYTLSQDHILHFGTIETIMSTILTHVESKVCGIHNTVPKSFVKVLERLIMVYLLQYFEM